VVNKSQKGESRDLGVRIREDKDSTSGLSLGDSVCVTDISAEKENSMVEKVGVVKAKDEQAVNIVINCKGDKEVINNSKKVFSAFNNNKNKDYKESNKDENTVSENRGGLGVNKVNSSNNKKEPSEVNVNKSDNKDCTKAGDNSRGVSVVRGDKNIGKRESR
jgi:hypothetical protein